MKNILITGGTGFLGKNLQNSFKEHNITGSFIGRGKNKEYDLLSYEKTLNLFSETKPNIVIHAAANVGGIGYNKKNPAHLIKDNLQMGINVLDACLEFEVENLYITSTCCSYPKFCPAPFKEDDLWNGKEEESNSPYGCAKKTIIKMSQAYRQQYGMKATCFILANLYGIYDNFDLESSHVVPALIRKFVEAKENNKSYVECWGTGTATRDLFAAHSLSDILTKVVVNQFDHHEPINLGTEKDIAIKDLALLIKELVGFDGEIVFTGEVSDGQPIRRLDCSRAKQLLNWQNEVSLKDGLIKTIEWFKNNRLL